MNHRRSRGQALFYLLASAVALGVAAAGAAVQSRLKPNPGAGPGVDLSLSSDSVLWTSTESIVATPRIRRSFDGLDQLQAAHEGSSTFPPDVSIAAGGGLVLEAANAALRLSGSDGSNPQVISLNAFFAQTEGPVLFQPTVFFDRMRARFYVAALSFDTVEKTSYLHFAVSGSLAFGLSPELSADSWCKFRYNVRRGTAYAGTLALGVNEFWVAATTDDFKFRRGRFKGASLYVIDKARFGAGDEAGNCLVPEVFTHRLSKSRDDRPASAVRPALHYSSNDLEGRPLFLVNTASLQDSSDLYRLWRIDRDRDGGPELSHLDLRGAEPYSQPPESPQRDAVDLATGDTRVTQAVFRGNRLWLAHTTGCEIGPPPEESCIRVVEITPGAAGEARISFEETLGKKNWFYWMAGMAVNFFGDAVVPFHRNRGNRFFGLAYSGKNSVEARFGRVKKLHKGKCGLVNLDDQGRNITGGRVAAQTDPEDDLGFWLAGEYPGAVPGLGCGWRTRVALARGAPPPKGIPVTLASGQLTAVGGERRSRHTVTVQTDGSAGSSGRLLVVALSDGSQTPGSCQSCATLDYAINSDESGFGPQLDVELPGGRRTYHLSLGHDLAVAHEPTPG